MAKKRPSAKAKPNPKSTAGSKAAAAAKSKPAKTPVPSVSKSGTPEKASPNPAPHKRMKGKKPDVEADPQVIIRELREAVGTGIMFKQYPKIFG